MTVSKELLQDLGIVSMHIQYFGTKESKAAGEDVFITVPCVLTKYDGGKLLFTLLESKTVDSSEACLSLSVRESDAFYRRENQKLNIIEQGLNYAVATTGADFAEPEGTIKLLLERLSVLDGQDEKYGRRKEPRVRIGREKSAAFGLSSVEQKIFSKTAKIIQPCAILDASLRGICVITPFENPAFKSLENFSIYLSFTNPEQTVILQAHKVHSKLSNVQNKVFSAISCQLLEPIHYVWKERVIKMLDGGSLSD